MVALPRWGILLSAGHGRVVFPKRFDPCIFGYPVPLRLQMPVIWFVRRVCICDISVMTLSFGYNVMNVGREATWSVRNVSNTTTNQEDQLISMIDVNWGGGSGTWLIAVHLRPMEAKIIAKMRITLPFSIWGLGSVRVYPAVDRVTPASDVRLEFDAMQCEK
jgi:hypothetical protein